MNPLARWRAWRTARRLSRIAEQAERERNAIIKAQAYRREKRMAFVFLYGNLRTATNRALAAEIGRPDLMKGM